MNISNWKQKFLSRAAQVFLSIYTVGVLSLIVAVMIWHRAWKIQPRGKS